MFTYGNEMAMLYHWCISKLSMVQSTVFFFKESPLNITVLTAATLKNRLFCSHALLVCGHNLISHGHIRYPRFFFFFFSPFFVPPSNSPPGLCTTVISQPLKQRKYECSCVSCWSQINLATQFYLIHLFIGRNDSIQLYNSFWLK